MSSGGRDSGGGFEDGALGGDVSDPARLTDRPGGDARSPEGWGIGLLRRAQPYRAPVGRKQRVRMGLAQVGKRRGALVLRPAIAIAVLVGCGAVASAALGRWPALMADAYHRLIAPSAPAAPRASDARGARATIGRARATASSAAPASAQPGEAAAVAVAEAPAVTPSPPAPASELVRRLVPVSAPARGTGASVRPSRHASSSSELGRAMPAGASRETVASARARRPSTATAGTDDTALVLEAMRALRVEGNPARARALLGRYLDRYPRGTLAEEALAMSIEAAIAHGDGDAGALAKSYRRLYPAGHFSKLARQTLDGDAPGARN